VLETRRDLLGLFEAWGALEEFAGVAHRSAFYSYLFFWIFMAISRVIIRLRYR
jgi:hypothetical protein